MLLRLVAVVNWVACGGGIVEAVLVMVVVMVNDVVMHDGVMMLDSIVVLDDIVVLKNVMVAIDINDMVLDVLRMVINQGILIDVFHLSDVMVHLMVLVWFMVMDLLDHNIMLEVMKGVVLLVMLLDHMVPMIVMVLSDWRRLVVDLRVVVHVRCGVMRRWLCLVMTVLVVYDWLVMHAIVVVNEVLIEVMVINVSVLVMLMLVLDHLVMILVMLWLLVMVRYVGVSRMVDSVVLMELMVHIGIIVMAVIDGSLFMLMLLVLVIHILVVLLDVVVVDGMPMVELSVEMMVSFMADGAVMLLIMVLKSQVLVMVMIM